MNFKLKVPARVDAELLIRTQLGEMRSPTLDEMRLLGFHHESTLQRRKDEACRAVLGHDDEDAADFCALRYFIEYVSIYSENHLAAEAVDGMKKLIGGKEK